MTERPDVTARRRERKRADGKPDRCAVNLTPEQIERALPRVERGLRKYWRLQSEFPRRDAATDEQFQRSFVGFYRVRRNLPWRRAFFRILEEAKTSRPGIAAVLGQLHESTSRIEASFASKLVATIDPGLPVIDSVVLRNLGLRLPTGSPLERIPRIASLHEELAECYARFLETDAGRHLLAGFTSAYPEYPITKTKMLDLVLWQTRDAPRSR